MRRLAPLALAAALTFLAGSTARADTFAIVPPGVPALPSSFAPNDPGSIVVPSLAAAPAQPLQLSYGELLGIWQSAGAAYGIPWQVLAAINKVESNFGRNMGPSSAGAVGWMQFMPDTWFRWGVDANGDGVADPWNPYDAIYSAARYLAAAGGSADLYGSVYSYNHADWYVKEVLDLAALYGADTTVAFTLDRLQQGLDEARRLAATAGERLHAAQRTLQSSTRSAARWQAKADTAALLSDRLAYEQQAGIALGRKASAEATIERLGRRLADAQRRLAQAQQAATPASFTPAASQLLAAPSYSGRYVFPVGGGPGSVTASHTHHDYPAVDIAAPMGAPLYALADGTVQRAWIDTANDCGIGFTLQAFDGQVWTYCHLSVLDPAVTAGARLAAGQPVGLVGATGRATGPHLHLQLQPATVWPQQEAWFQGFADTAFTWSDGGAADAGGRTLQFSSRPPVFAVIPAGDHSNGVVYFSRSGA